MSVPNQWDKRKDEIDARVEEKLKAEGLQPPFQVTYSAYDSYLSAKGEMEIGDDHLDEVAIQGKCRFVAPPSPFWGGPESRGYVSGLLENPTWLDLCVIVEVQIRTTQDFHHVYLENVEDAHQSEITLAEILALGDGEDVQYKRLGLGS